MKTTIKLSVEIESVAKLPTRIARVERTGYKWTRYGEQPFKKWESIDIVDWHGVPVELRRLVKLLKGIKATRLKSVDVQPSNGGVELTYSRGRIFLKGIVV